MKSFEQYERELKEDLILRKMKSDEIDDVTMEKPS
jgi:hypothetical protein